DCEMFVPEERRSVHIPSQTQTTMYNANGNSIINTGNEDFTGGNMTLLDATGNIVCKQTITENIVTVNTSTLASGIYLVVLSRETIHKTVKLIITK
ncbi:MAG TPA: T9SS type A sorting domain-containing protein, partial [Flavobacteriales bacterium]|nr:T9SS type A sorting domain-containing protein [Flavobacteriales bacterium]